MSAKIFSKVHRKIILFVDKMILWYWRHSNIYQKRDSQLVEELKRIFATSKRPMTLLAKKSKASLRERIDAVLPMLKERSLATKVFWIMNGLRDFPRCRTCLRRDVFSTKNVQSATKGYLLHCSLECSASDLDVLEQQQKTSMKQNGTKWPMQSNKILAKARQRCIEKHGVENVSQLSEVKAQKLATTAKNFGKDNLFNRKKAAATQKKAPRWKKQAKLQKFMQTNIERRGVAFPTQSHEVISKQRGVHSLDGKMFKSSWELAKYIWHRDRNDDFEYLPNVAFEYEQTDGKLHKYFPDFRVGDHYEEVKGNQFIREDGTMLLPYKKGEWTEAEYEEACENYERKRKCMLANGVVILSGKDVKTYLAYVRSAYGKDYLASLKAFRKGSK